MRYAIGIDVGGRSAKMAVVAADGAILARRSVPTLASTDAQELLNRLHTGVNALKEEAHRNGWEAAAIGLGWPGLVDRQRGTVAYATNLGSLDGYPLRSALEQQSGLPVAMDNDVNCAALGEYAFGAGQGSRRMFCVAIGTGVGAALIVDGELVRITFGGLGDPGHIIVNPDALERCTCGGRGCLEHFVSAPALERRATALASGTAGPLADLLKERGALAAADISAAAQAGDPVAITVLQEAARWLGVALASWANLFSPDRVVIGGGVGNAGELLLAPTRRWLREYGMPFLTSELEVISAARPDDAGILGAAKMALDLA